MDTNQTKTPAATAPEEGGGVKYKHIKVYLAGRIKKMDHHSLGRFGVADPSIDEYDTMETDATKFIREMETDIYLWHGSDSAGKVEFLYTGPFTVSNDHGSAHCVYTEWNSTTGQHDKFGFGTCNHGSYSPSESSPAGKVRSAVLSRALSGIKNCDAFIAWIEDEECFGTLAEIGYAKALGKPIFIGLAPNVRLDGELWFALNMATKVHYENPNSGTEGGPEQTDQKSVVFLLDLAAQHLRDNGALR